MCIRDSYGPVDGHNLDELLDTLQYVRNLDGVVLLHVKTEKGKGMPKLEEKDDRYHGVSPKPPEAPKKPDAQKDPIACSVEPTVVIPAAEQPRKKARSWTNHFT